MLAETEALLPGEITPDLKAERARFRARLDARHGRHEQVDGSFRAATAGFRELDLPFRLAVVQLEHAEWLAEQGRADEGQPLLEEARDAFTSLQASPWLERLNAVAPGAAATTVPA